MENTYIMTNKFWGEINDNQAEIVSGGRRNNPSLSVTISNFQAAIVQVNGGNGTVNYYITYSSPNGGGGRGRGRH
jgi:hypothetical protein